MSEEDLDVDSLGVVELLMPQEDEFDVKIPDEEAESIVTVGLLLVPFALVFGLMSMRASAIVARVGERQAITAGLLVCVRRNWRVAARRCSCPTQ